MSAFDRPTISTLDERNPLTLIYLNTIGMFENRTILSFIKATSLVLTSGKEKKVISPSLQIFAITSHILIVSYFWHFCITMLTTYCKEGFEKSLTNLKKDFFFLKVTQTKRPVQRQKYLGKLFIGFLNITVFI